MSYQFDIEEGIILKEIKISELQDLIRTLDNGRGTPEEYFYKLTEEVGELSKAIRKNIRLSDQGEIKGTIEEELYDVLCYVVCLANSYNINLEECMYMKEELNAKKYNRKNIFEAE